MKNDRLPVSSLENPLYYLENFHTVLRWVRQHHADLLNPEELTQLEDFDSLPLAAQGLLVRLVMRSGSVFRQSKLSYPELGEGESLAVQNLSARGWLDTDPQIELTSLFRLFTRAELQTMLAGQLEQVGVGKTDTKKNMLEAMLGLSLQPVVLEVWAPGLQDTVLALTGENLFERVQLMFFGNLRQGWSEFVLSELGHQRYEEVPFSPRSRAFEQREEVDSYLHLARCREALEAGEDPADLYQRVPLTPEANGWLEERRGRLLYALGHQAERQGNQALALQAYSASANADALVRRLRVLEKAQQYESAYELSVMATQNPQNAKQAQAVARVHGRVCKKLGLAAPVRAPAKPIPEMNLSLPEDSAGQVESATALALAGQGEPVCFVENTLFNGLFALLCWSAIYAPLKGAFFHPFHAAPADLHREGFVSRRQDLFEACLSAFESGDYQQRIRETFHAKQDISCTFLHWPLLDEVLLELALECIPAAHLRQIFGHMLDDVRHNRAGIPDLIRFVPGTQSYQLIEVKGPGDRLQDNQRRWFEFFHRHDIPAVVCKVSWA